MRLKIIFKLDSAPFLHRKNSIRHLIRTEAVGGVCLFQKLTWNIRVEFIHDRTFRRCDQFAAIDGMSCDIRLHTRDKLALASIVQAKRDIMTAVIGNIADPKLCGMAFQIPHQGSERACAKPWEQALGHTAKAQQ